MLCVLGCSVCRGQIWLNNWGGCKLIIHSQLYGRGHIIYIYIYIYIAIGFSCLYLASSPGGTNGRLVHTENDNNKCHLLINLLKKNIKCGRYELWVYYWGTVVVL